MNLLPQLYKNRALTDELLGEKSRSEASTLLQVLRVEKEQFGSSPGIRTQTWRHFKCLASAVGLESRDPYYRIGVGKVKPLYVVLGSGVVDGDIPVVDDPNLEIWAFREKGFDCTVSRFEADSPQGSLNRIMAGIVLPFECNVKLPMVFEPCHRCNRSLSKRHGENFIRVVYFDHVSILVYGVGKVKPNGRTGRDRTFDR